MLLHTSTSIYNYYVEKLQSGRFSMSQCAHSKWNLNWDHKTKHLLLGRRGPYMTCDGMFYPLNNSKIKWEWNFWNRQSKTCSAALQSKKVSFGSREASEKKRKWKNSLKRYLFIYLFLTSSFFTFPFIFPYILRSNSWQAHCS